MKPNLMLSRLNRSFSYSLKGIGYAFKTQANFRIECAIAILVTSMGFVYRLSTIEWVIISLCIGAVLAAEIVNTSIEKLVDLIQPEFDLRAGIIKDLASAMVLIVAIGSAVCGLLIFLPKIF